VPIPAPEPITLPEIVPAPKPLPTPKPIPARKTIPAPEPSPTSKPILASKSIPDYKKIPVGSSTSADDQDLWMGLGPLIPRIISILFSLMIEFLIHHIYQRCWRKENRTEEEMSELRKLLDDATGLMSEFNTMLALVKDENDCLFAQLLKETQSMEKTMKLKDKRNVECHNEKQHAQFQNAMDSARNRLKKVKECYIKFRNETDLMKVLERTSMSLKQKL
jgi:uncharacterized membrane-anchored protein YhcB (DUF1043 family)